MAISDLILFSNWYLILFFIGLVFLPTTVIIFSSFFDKGYAFSKVIGIITISFLIWLLASLHILTFSTLNIFLIVIASIIFNLFLLFKKNLKAVIQNNLKIFLLEEFIFAAGFIFWVFIRAHQPDIHGLEKFMDFGFVNSILRSDYFPPKDMWLTPFTINYYYFGHLVTAVLIKLTGVDSAIGFNLMLSLIFALTLSCSFSIGANIYYFFERNFKKVIIAGIISSLLVTISGNMQTIYAFFGPYNIDAPAPFWNLPLVNNLAGYFYPNATRFIPKTIHEFPMYTTVVADLHGHLLNTPFAILVVALLVVLFFNKTNLFFNLLLGFMIAVSFMTNFLDGLIYIMFSALVIFFKNFRNNKFIKSFELSIKPILITIVSSVAFSLPFWLSFKPFGSGISLICPPKFLINIGSIGPFLFEADRCTRTPLWMFLILYGLFIFLFARFFTVIFTKNWNAKKFSDADYLILIFFVFGLISIIIPELIYFKDIYAGYFRSNTMFKFSYQVFIASSIAGSYIIVRTYPKFKNYLSSLYLTALVFLLFLALLFPYFAIKTYYNNLNSYFGLDGIKYLSRLYPSDYQAILWIRQNIKGQPVILEANGESYTDFARVSANTGLPTVIGWPVHEWLWRGTYGVASARIPDVQILYETSNLEKTLQLIEKYNIQLVFIGTLERQKYSNISENKFNILGKIIYTNGPTTIYQITTSKSNL
ncbi:MAG: DUF2298 domain-containing protein [Patescibacteria group bacterium]